jgi:hypothetical protein
MKKFFDITDCDEVYLQYHNITPIVLQTRQYRLFIVQICIYFVNFAVQKKIKKNLTYTTNKSKIN